MGNTARITTGNTDLVVQGIERHPTHQAHELRRQRFEPFYQGLRFIKLTLSRAIFQI